MKASETEIEPFVNYQGPSVKENKPRLWRKLELRWAYRVALIIVGSTLMYGGHFLLAFTYRANSSADKTAADEAHQQNLDHSKSKCPLPREPKYVGDQVLSPGHSNCTLGWSRGDPGFHFSQNLEDAVIYHRFFSGGSPLAYLGRENGANSGNDAPVSSAESRGFFVEMGALDGIIFSNTLMYEQCLGWDGLLIEALPGNFDQLQVNRPCAATIGEAVCSHEEGPSIRMGGHTGVAFDTSTRGDYDGDFVEVPCRPLADILEENGVRRIHFFSLDVEGAELKVLKTLDFSRVQIDVLVVEADFVTNANAGGAVKELDQKIKEVRDLVTTVGGMRQVRSRMDSVDPNTGAGKDLRLCERNGYADEINCMFLSIAGSDVFVSAELYEYDTEPWKFPV